ncbi:cupin domain-containing protein [Skermanella pratensis]|uniref:cupin domain-containing protein n=1 Tax=Skermanella pratensis TaxID=2233999 RepID=UPI001B3B9394
MSVAGEGSRHLWFLDTEVLVKVSHVEGSDGISVLEHRAPHGDSPPLHIHRNEDEIFQVLEGEIHFRVADTDVQAIAGDTLLAPKGTPHLPGRLAERSTLAHHHARRRLRGLRKILRPAG